MKTYLYLLILVLGLSSCAIQVYSDYDKGAVFTNYKTFAWINRPDSIDDIYYNNQLVDGNIKRYVSQELIQRGYKPDTMNPDILLEYNAVIRHGVQNLTTPVYANPYPYYGYAPFGYPYYGYGYYANPVVVGYNTQQVPYTEGTLVIEVIDRKTNQLVWKGWSVGTLNNEEDLEQQLPKDIRKIFTKYPVKSVEQ